MMTPMDNEAAPQPAPVELPAPPELEPEPEPVKKRGLGNLLLGTLFWPRSTFAYLRDHGGRSWLLPLLLAVLLVVASRVVAIPIEKAQSDAAIAAIQSQLGSNPTKGGNVQIFTTGGPGGPANFTSTGGPASPLLDFGLPVLGVIWDWLLRGGLLLGLAWLLGGRPGGGAMFRLSSWTLLPTIARLLVTLAVMLIAHRVPLTGLQGFGGGPVGGGPVNITVAPGGDNTFTSTSTGSASTDTSGPAIQVGPGGGGNFGPAFLPLLQSSFLGALDLYTLWGLLLMLIGVAVTARLGVIKSALTTAGYWAVSLVLATLPPLLSFMLLTLAGPGRLVGP
jgi:hypothetical protein